MPQTLIKDYGPHKAGDSPAVDPVRAAWLAEHGYYEAETWPLKTAPADYLAQREGEDPETWTDTVRERVALARRLVAGEEG